MKSAKLIAAALLLYITGVATGVVAVRVFVSRRSPTAGLAPVVQLEWIKKAAHSVNLPDAKQARIDGLVKESQRRLRKLWEPIAPVAKAEAQLVYQRAISELSPEEQTRFKAWLRETAKRRPGLTNLLSHSTNAEAISETRH